MSGGSNTADGRAEQVVTNVYVFANGMVMVFDQVGQQICHLQGRRDKVLPLIREVFDGTIEGEEEPLKWMRPT